MRRQHQIFKRIVVYVVNQRYGDLSDVFWSWPDNPLEEEEAKYQV